MSLIPKVYRDAAKSVRNATARGRDLKTPLLLLLTMPRIAWRRRNDTEAHSPAFALSIKERTALDRSLSWSIALYGLIFLWGIAWIFMALLGLTQHVALAILGGVVGGVTGFLATVQIWERSCLRCNQWRPYKDWLLGRDRDSR